MRSSFVFLTLWKLPKVPLTIVLFLSFIGSGCRFTFLEGDYAWMQGEEMRVTPHLNPPFVTIDSPIEGTYVGADVLLSGSCQSDRQFVHIYDGSNDQEILASTLCGDEVSEKWEALVDLRTFEDGVVILSALHLDGLNNRSDFAYTFFHKTTKPLEMTFDDPADGTYINVTNLAAFQVSGTCAAHGNDVVIDVTGGSRFEVLCNIGNWSKDLDLTSTPDESEIIFYVNQSDNAGNIAPEVVRVFPKNLDVPEVAFLNPDSGELIYNDTVENFVINGTCSEEGQDVEISLGGVIIDTPTCSAGGWSSELDLSAQPDGAFTLDLAHQNIAGNEAAEANRGFIKATDAVELEVTGISSPLSAGDQETVTVRALDAGGEVAKGYRGSVLFTSTDAQADLPSVYTFEASDEGERGFSDLVLKTVGTHTVSVTDQDLGSLAGEQVGIVVNHSTPAKLVFDVQPSDITADEQMNDAVTVRVLDEFDNLVLIASDSVSLSIHPDHNPGSGVLTSVGGHLSVSPVGGIASFENLNVDKVGQGYRLRAFSGSLDEALSDPFNVIAGAVDRLVWSAEPPLSTVAGVNFSASVEAYDAQDNLVPGVSITLAAFDGGTDVSSDGAYGVAGLGSLSTGSSGEAAVFSSIQITRSGTDYTLVATSGDVSPSSSDVFVITHAALDRLAWDDQFAVNDEFVAENSAQGHIAPLDVRAEDQYGNAVPSLNVVVSILDDASGSSAALGGATTRTTNALGVAQFDNLWINLTGAGYTLSARDEDDDVASITSNAFNVIAGAVDRLVWSAEPPLSTVAGVNFSASVEAYDAQDNLVPGVSITLAAFDGGTDVSSDGSYGVAGLGSLSTGSSGEAAVFGSIKITRSGTDYTLVATDGDVSSAPSGVFMITPAGPHYLAFGTQPTTTVAGASITPAVSVRIYDAFDNFVDTATNSVSLTFGTNAGSGTLSGGTAVAAVEGVATFSALSVNNAAIGYTLVASSTGLTSSDPSDSFDITPGAATQLAFDDDFQPEDAVSGASIGTVRVRILDAAGNLTSSTESVTLSLLDTGSTGAALSGTLTQGAEAGVAEFTGLSVDLVGTYQLEASSGSLTIDQSDSFTITAGVSLAENSDITGTTDIRADDVETSTVTITLRDASSNPVPGVVPTFSATGTGNSYGVCSATDSNGESVCTLSSTVAEVKTLSITGPVSKVGDSVAFVPGTARYLAFGTQPTTTVAGASITPAVSVRIYDEFSNFVDTATNSVSLAFGTDPTSGSATLSGGTAVAAVEGVATFSALSVNNAATGYTLVASSSELTDSAPSSEFNIMVGAVDRLVWSADPPLSTVAGVNFSASVEAYDAQDNLVPGVSITLAAFDGGTDVSSDGAYGVAGLNPVSTGSSGEAAVFSSLQITRSGTDYRLVATDGDVSSAPSGVFVITPAGPDYLAFGTQPTTTVAGASITPAVSVRIYDAFDNFVDTATNSVSLAFGTNAGSGTLSGGTAVAAVEGVATFSALSVNNAATGYTLVASSTGLTSSDPSDSFEITPGAATQLAFDDDFQPEDAVSGASIGTVSVRILDAAGNLTSSTDSVTLSLLDTGSTGAVLSGSTSVAAVSGIATFTGLNVNLVGTYELEASSGSLTTDESDSFTITPSAATQLAFDDDFQPEDAVSGASIGTVSVRILDAAGNLTSSTDSVTLSLLDTGSTGAVLSGSASVAAVSGIATFTGLNVNLVGTYELEASSGSLTTDESDSFTITPSAASMLSFSDQPQDATSGASIGTVSVRILDAAGNLTSSTDSVTLSLLDTGSTGAVLSGSASVAAVSGIATFTGLNVNLVGTYELEASSGSLTTDESDSFTITPSAASMLSFSDQPQDALSGASIGTVSVRILDAAGNLTSSTDSVTLSLLDTGSTGAVLSGSASVAAVSGVATFTGLNVNLVGTYELEASSGSLTTDESDSFTITPSTATQLAFDDDFQPEDAVSGASIGTVSVRILDAAGNLTSSTDSVTLSLLDTGSTGAVLSGSASVAAVSGIATFTGLNVNLVGTYELEASSGSLTTDESDSFTITPSAATQLAFDDDFQPEDAVSGASIGTVSVRILDAAGNLTSSTDSVTLSLLDTGSTGAVLSGSASVAAVSGIATFTGLNVNLVGTYELEASSGSLTTDESDSFTITPSAASMLSFSDQPQDALSGASIGTVSVRILDAAGNLTSSTDSVTLSLLDTGSTGAVLSGSASVAAVSGIATFTGLNVNLVGTYELEASSGSLTTDESDSFTITPSAATQLAFDDDFQPEDAVSGASIGTVSVRILDAAGNLTSSTDSVHTFFTRYRIHRSSAFWFCKRCSRIWYCDLYRFKCKPHWNL
jgi:hypothetical protein